MSLLRARDIMLRRTAVQTTVLLLSVVAALVVGLLAMHTFTSPMGNHNEPAATMAMDANAPGDLAAGDMVTGGRDAVALPYCSVTCDLGHNMVGMVCVLAILFTALSLLAAASANVTEFWPRARLALSRMIAFAAAPGNPQPDLNALSISRT
ncbi:MAG: hypothetical protein JWP05_1052 [Microbacteriaceae bacterium]|nr:hypothetical protein [Microbacteriaceae bacterium]